MPHDPYEHYPQNRPMPHPGSTPMPTPPTDDDLRANYRYLIDLAYKTHINRDEALDLVVIASELGSRGYTLNAAKSDWIPKGEGDANTAD